MSDGNGNIAEGNDGERHQARPRGRPRGSRNRPNRDAPALVDLNVPPGVELINWVIGYSSENNVCVNVISGTGRISIAELTDLEHPLPSRFTELLNLISISGACFSPVSVPTATIFNAMLRRENGTVVSGTVLTMTTMDYAVLNAVVYRNPFFIEAPRA